MIVRNGAGFRWVFKHFVLRNWIVVAVVVGFEEAIYLADLEWDVTDNSPFSVADSGQ